MGYNAVEIVILSTAITTRVWPRQLILLTSLEADMVILADGGQTINIH